MFQKFTKMISLTAFAAGLALAGSGCSDSAAPGFTPGTYAVGLIFTNPAPITSADFDSWPQRDAIGTLEVSDAGVITGTVDIDYFYAPGAIGSDTDFDIEGQVEGDGNGTFDILDADSNVLLTVTGQFGVGEAIGGATVAGMQGDVTSEAGEEGIAAAILTDGTADVNFICGLVSWEADDDIISDDGYAPFFAAVQNDQYAGIAAGEDLYMAFDGNITDTAFGNTGFLIDMEFDADVAGTNAEPLSVDAESGETLRSYSGTENSGTNYVDAPGGTPDLLNAGFINSAETFGGYIYGRESYCYSD